MLSLILSAGLAAGSCGCADTLRDVAAATEQNYAGYHVKVADEKQHSAYRQFRELLLRDAASVRAPAECQRVLDAYVAFFDDAHLFVKPPAANAPATEEAAADRPAGATVSARAPEIPQFATRWTPEKVDFRLRREDSLDPIEGMWRDDQGEFAIVHDAAFARGEYVAFRFSYRHGTRPGEVLALVRPAGDGTYNVHYRSSDDSWQQARATLNRQTGIFNFAGIGWQRTGEINPTKSEAAVAQAQPEIAAPKTTGGDPLTPQFRVLGDDMFYLSLPSFMPRFREPLNDILATHGEALAEAKGLVIDLRGNSGGDAIYFGLAEYLLTGPIVVSEANAVLASDWNIEYFERFREQLGDRGAYLDPVLKRMRDNRGEIVPYLEERVEGPQNLKTGPKQIVVLQDRGVGSAAEAFLLHFGQSDKVVTMGEASRGNIDYQQVSMRTLGCGANEILFGYPLYMRSRDLPQDSLDDRGIAPDVRLSPVHGDWVRYAERWLRNR